MKIRYRDAAPSPQVDLCETIEGMDAAAEDEILLRQFVAVRDELAFAELVTRHGSLVLAVCRRTLGNQQDAEDAFQATFLVLARKAASVRTARSLPAWLYQTAYRISLRARAGRTRRREQPLETEIVATDVLSRITADYDQSIVDQEMNRLPEKYRLPVFLCCLENKSLSDAATQLGWSLGSVKGRLERGRQELRRRITMRRASAAVAVAMIAGMTQTAEAAPAVSPSLIAATVQGGMQYAAGQGALGYVTHRALSLANGSFQIMTLPAAKLIACSLLSVGLLTYGGSQLPAPVQAGGGTIDAPFIIMQTDFNDSVAADPFDQALAFLAEDERRDGERKAVAREGDGDRKPAAREGDREKRSAVRDGEEQRKKESGESREGVKVRTDEREGVPTDFEPQNAREKLLLQMILQLRNEVAQLRKELNASGRREGGETAKPAQRDGDAREKPALRDSDRPVKEGARDGDRPTKEGQRDGDARPKEGARDSDTPRKNGARDEKAPTLPKPRDGEYSRFDRK